MGNLGRQPLIYCLDYALQALTNFITPFLTCFEAFLQIWSTIFLQSGGVGPPNSLPWICQFLDCNFVFLYLIEKHNFQRRSSDQTTKRSDRRTLSSADFSKRSQRKLPQTPTISPKGPTARLDYGKSYTNRCVREILNKLEQGPYASEWYNFSNPNVPSPKWINFSLDESGGVLDAFLCKKDDENHTCYMMDVRIGEKVGRLFKYPSPIRVGRNGYVVDHNDNKSHYNFMLEDTALTYSRSSGRKSRPFPLCWSEQFEWEDVGILALSAKFFRWRLGFLFWYEVNLQETPLLCSFHIMEWYYCWNLRATNTR